MDFEGRNSVQDCTPLSLLGHLAERQTSHHKTVSGVCKCLSLHNQGRDSTSRANLFSFLVERMSHFRILLWRVSNSFPQLSKICPESFRICSRAVSGVKFSARSRFGSSDYLCWMSMPGLLVPHSAYRKDCRLMLWVELNCMWINAPHKEPGRPTKADKPEMKLHWFKASNQLGREIKGIRSTVNGLL